MSYKILQMSTKCYVVWNKKNVRIFHFNTKSKSYSAIKYSVFEYKIKIDVICLIFYKNTISNNPYTWKMFHIITQNCCTVSHINSNVRNYLHLNKEPLFSHLTHFSTISFTMYHSFNRYHLVQTA